MRNKLMQYGPLMIALILVVLCANVFTIYVSPMEDVSLDLSLVPREEGMVTENFDNKGWSVYIQEGDSRTELDPNGFGGFSGLELGQTFYYSRVLNEELDSPTLQLDPVEWQFSVWLDDDLIYTDCPELDNRIGYLRLPMNDGIRDNAITISLPSDYLGKTLTIAQSFPEWSETDRVMAYPTTVQLYCGYAYESGLISETYQTSLLAMLTLLLTLAMLVVFVRHRDWSTLCLAIVAFLWMVQQLWGTSYYFRYVTSHFNNASVALPLASTLALLCYLILRGGKHRKWLWISLVLYALSAIVYIFCLSMGPRIKVRPAIVIFLMSHIPVWLAFFCLIAVLVMGTIWWRKESRYYRLFIPLSYVGIALSWILEMASGYEWVWKQIVTNFASGQVLYLYNNTLPGIIAAALITTVVEAIKAELALRSEKQLIEQRKQLVLASYDNLRHQHEEVMMLRHDMLRHFRTLRDMNSAEKRTAYLTELIGQNEKIRPVVESGNEMLDIILNARLGAAVDAGIHVEIPHVVAPAALPLSDPDLCTLVMNIVDNAIAAASKAVSPYVLLKVHARDGFLGIVCENSFAPQELEAEAKKETVPKHGLGLKIVKGIVTKYSGAITEKNEDGRFIVKIAIPL